MSDPYLGEIKVTSFNFPPKGWAFCNGQSLPINTNQALFAILGTRYGGDGVTTFKLPNLQGRMPVHQGSGYDVGTSGGEEAHALTVNEMPTHTHSAVASSARGTTSNPTNARWAESATGIYAQTPNTLMSAQIVDNAGSGQSHENRPPYLVLNYIIALTGVFPSQS